MKKWLCSECGEQFWIEAATYEKAVEDASMWGAEVIGEIMADGSVKVRT